MTGCQCTAKCKSRECGGPGTTGLCGRTDDLSPVSLQLIDHPEAGHPGRPNPPTCEPRHPVCRPCRTGLERLYRRTNAQYTARTRTVPPPLACPTTWTAVMEAADYRCRCTGTCGTRHTTSAAYCLARHGDRLSRGQGGSRLRLIAAPTDPTLDATTAAGIPAADLHPWCPRCYDAARRAARRRPTGPDPCQAELFSL